MPETRMKLNLRRAILNPHVFPAILVGLLLLVSAYFSRQPKTQYQYVAACPLNNFPECREMEAFYEKMYDKDKGEMVVNYYLTNFEDASVPKKEIALIDCEFEDTNKYRCDDKNGNGWRIHVTGAEDTDYR